MRENVAVQHELADQRIDDMDGDVGIGEKPSVEELAPEVDDPDRVGLRRRSKRALPNADPISVRRQPEIGKEAPDRGVLFIHA